MKPPVAQRPDTQSEAALRQVLATFFDAAWYSSRYPDVGGAGMDPLRHFMLHGAAERRDPNRWFDSAWYSEYYPDVGTTGANPLLHYLQSGGVELRNPHPRFDAVWYVGQHPDAAGNPLLYHLRTGAALGFLTEKSITIADYLPSVLAPAPTKLGVSVDIIIPVFKGYTATKRCLDSLFADPNRMPGRIIVIDDQSPEPRLSAWLRRLAARGSIKLLTNDRNLGFVASVNRGIQEAGSHDVVLLNSDTEVPTNWLPRLAAQAYARSDIASISPFSNNATICGYPNNHGGPLPPDRTLAAMDTICRSVNAGRWVDVPTTVGFCMYIRRAVLNEVGLFDAAAFGRGYGEENDFCRRSAARGWRHVLACDVFVYHEGAVSFGDETNDRVAAAMRILSRRYPDYAALVAKHVRDDDVGPYRFAITAALFAQSGLPTILMVSHDLGGGVRHHIESLITTLLGKANCLMLLATPRGSQLSVPALHGHPVLDLPGERLDDLARLLRALGVTRLHVHHLAGMDMDVRGLVHRLGVRFDLTVHDYYGICPQVNLLPWLDGAYCGEPAPAVCNGCIADRPSHGARDILAWRWEHAWQYREADRVICPSTDVYNRLVRFGVAERALVAPHEPIPAGPWPMRSERLRTGKIRIALIGILANHKGAAMVEAVVQHADPATHEFHLIGDTETGFPPETRDRLRITGRYREADLQALLREIRPHVLWFPPSWPETYSYTISAGITAGLPIIASRIGALPERLAERPLTWLVEPGLSPEPWLAAFEHARAALRQPIPARVARAAVEDFYADQYLSPPIRPQEALIDLRRPGRIAVVAIPERFGNGAYSPCGYIRLLLPLDRLAVLGDINLVVADAQSALRYRADVLVTQRYALETAAEADALAAHAKATGARLVYDLDDDLLNIPRDHPDAATLRPRAKIVRRMLRHAHRVVVSTPALAISVGHAARVVTNALDERLWGLPQLLDDHTPHRGPVRILCMGTATHDADFEMIAPALSRVHQVFRGRVEIGLLGFSSKDRLPEFVTRIAMPHNAHVSYPGFVHWITQQPSWDIGLAPLVDTGFNRCKSALKTLDYAALGIPVLASDVPIYQGSLADGMGGQLVANTEEAWYAAICRIVRDTRLRRELARGAVAAYAADGILPARLDAWRAIWAA